MAIQVASLFGVIDLKDNLTPGLNTAKTSLDNFGTNLTNIGRSISGFGQQLSIAMAPVAIALAGAAKASMDFGESITNIGAVMGLTGDEINALHDDLLEIGEGTRAGPQAVADAFYDIVGGVADATTHMAILDAAIRTSEAGNASLTGTTKALISVMNSYGFAASDASMVSDVLTQTVNKGVGSMDEFAAAFPNVAGLANTLGISFQDLGTMMAYLTTKGNSASEATTQISAAMMAFFTPNTQMQAALKELGFESGEAAIKQLGLVGALEAVSGTTTSAEEGFAFLMGRQEALRGATSLLDEGYSTFFTNFGDGLQGATDAARAIQLTSAAAQFDLLKSSVSTLAITVGDELMVALTPLIGEVTKIVQSITEWINANPEAARTILLVLGALVVLGPVLMVVGGAISLIGTIVGVATTAFGLLSGAVAFLASPIIIIGAAIAGLVAILGSGEGGLAGGLSRAAQAAQALAGIFAGVLLRAAQAAQAIVQGVVNVVTALVNKVKEAIGLDLQAQNQAAAENLLATNPPSWVTQIRAGAGIDANGPAIGHAMGGSVSAGQQYLVGERGPELFTPGSSGSITPNSAMGGVQIGQVVIHANSASEGRAAADGFERRLKELRLSRGLT